MENHLAATRPQARSANLPRTRWTHQKKHALWNRVGVAAAKDHARPLIDSVPSDIGQWCPRYPELDAQGRSEFWIGFLSALAKHESTYRPDAVGGGGKWYGLVQIAPATARGYGCRARTGAALTRGAANVSCALRILAVTVPRDGVIFARDSRWRGVAADWGPLRSPSKRRDIAAWTRNQPVCAPLDRVRPRARSD